MSPTASGRLLKLGVLTAGAVMMLPSAMAHAQNIGVDESVILVSSPPIPDDDDISIVPIVRTSNECGPQSVVRTPASLALGCPFAANSLGLTFAESVDLPDGAIKVTVGLVRGSDGALSLGRQLQRTSATRLRENTLALIGSETRLFDGRLEVASTIGWSRSSERDIASAALLSGRQREKRGFSQSYTFKAKLVDRPGFRWRLDGTLSRASEDFRSDGSYGTLAQLTGQGDEDSIGTRLRLGEFDLKASFADRRTNLTQAQTRKVSLGYSGISLGYLGRDGRTIPDPSYFIGPSESRNETWSLDVDLFSLAPMIALEDRGLISLIPKQLTLSVDRREMTRPESATRALTRRQGLGLFGMWETPLGDTLLDFSRDHLSDGSGNPIERNRQLLVTHGFAVGQWKVDLDLLTMKTNAVNFEEDNTTYYGASIGRSFANGAKVKLNFGIDSLSFGGVESDFALRDKSHRVKLELDLSPVLQRRFQNRSFYLTLAAQMRLNRSDYQLRFLDEVIDSGTDGFARQGVLASFGFSF